MTQLGFRVMDSDMHVCEPPDLWPDYIEPAYLDRAPIGLPRGPRDFGLMVEGRTIPIPSVAPPGATGSVLLA